MLDRTIGSRRQMLMAYALFVSGAHREIFTNALLPLGSAVRAAAGSHGTEFILVELSERAPLQRATFKHTRMTVSLTIYLHLPLSLPPTRGPALADEIA
jgi:hypothetical protein